MNIIEKFVTLPTIRAAKNAAGRNSRHCVAEIATLKVVLICKDRNYTFYFNQK